MIIGIIGLGLIGGSLAKSIKAKTQHAVLAYDVDQHTMSMAGNCGAYDGILTPEKLRECGMIFLAAHPSKSLGYMKAHSSEISRNATVIDLCGVKRAICDEIFPLAREKGFTFIGGHPMAGREKGGFTSSESNLFEGASMILTPDTDNPISPELSRMLEEFFAALGFSSVIYSSPEKHDRIIAFTSHLPHIISSAYAKSHDGLDFSHGFTAGSFSDMVRVAGMDAELWTELFLLNRDFLIAQIEGFREKLGEYLDVLKANDPDKLKTLIREVRP